MRWLFREYFWRLSGLESGIDCSVLFLYAKPIANANFATPNAVPDQEKMNEPKKIAWKLLLPVRRVVSNF
jgi:hypothetical protein